MQYLCFIILLVLSSLPSYSREQTELEKYLDTLRSAYVVPGLAAAVYVDGKPVEHAVSGIRKVGSEELISKSDKFHLGSCTKAMTATLAATFVEEGKLSWDSKLGELFPELKLHPDLKDVPYQSLLAHRSGLIKDPSDELHIELETRYDSTGGREKIAEIFLTGKPEHKSRTFNYSNVGYMLAGHVLERISGKSWEMLMQERIFIPLGMKSCGFGPTSLENEQEPSQPWGHIIQDWGIKAVHNDNAPFYGPSANVHCSIPDWVKFLYVHLDGFNRQSDFLKQESFDQLHRIWPEDHEKEKYTVGGWYRLERTWAKGEVLTHTGTNTYNFAAVWMAPKTRTILMSTANRGNYSGSWATSDALSKMLKLFIEEE